MTVDIHACPREDRNLMVQLYEDTYPKERRLPFKLLESISKDNDNVTFDVIYENMTPLGFMYLVQLDGVMYLMYFAVQGEFRGNQNVISEIQNLAIIHENVIACTDEFIYNGSSWQQPYLIGHGFHKTGAQIIECREPLNVLSTLDGYVPTEDIVKERHSGLSNDLIDKMTIKKLFQPDTAKFYIYEN